MRNELGRKTGALRRAGLMPAVVYGEGIVSQSVTVAYKDFEKAFRDAGESTLLKLDVDGKSHTVLIHDTVSDPIRGTFLHADFYAVRMDKKIRIRVPFEFVGDSLAVKNEGAVILKVMQELEVEALPADLPHSIDVDMTRLVALNDRIYVKDLKLSKGVSIAGGHEDIIVIAEPPKSEDELKAELELPAESAPVEIKTEREEKVAAKEAKAKEESAIVDEEKK